MPFHAAGLVSSPPLLAVPKSELKSGRSTQFAFRVKGQACLQLVRSVMDKPEHKGRKRTLTRRLDITCKLYDILPKRFSSLRLD